MPVIVTFAIGVAVLGACSSCTTEFGIGWAALCGGLVLLAAGAVAGGVAVVAKWLVVGRIRPSEHPLWSSFVWRNEVADTFVETVAAPWFARAASGTPVMNLWLRALGAKIGRGVWCETYWLPEADLVTLGEGSTVNRGCVVQTHLFHDRIMRMDTVVLEPGATLGPHCVALPASRLGAGATVGPASLVMRGEEVPPSTRWQGNPIAPWNPFRKKSGGKKPPTAASRMPPREGFRQEAAKKASGAVIDPYLPNNGNFGYHVSHYDLDLEYKVAINRLSGSATITAVTLTQLRTFTLDLSDCADGGQGVGERQAPRPLRLLRQASCTSGWRRRCRPGPSCPIVVRYGGSPRPVRSLWGDVGFEELSDGVLVAGQPNGAASWFPCDDHPSAKASYRIRVSTESPYTVIANGALVSRQARAAQTVWTYEQPEPTSTYLATLQIGMYEMAQLTEAPVPMRAALPERLRRNFDHDFGRQPEMMKLFIELFGPYPLSSGYTVVVTDDDLEIPLEAQGISIFGANHCDGTRAHERLSPTNWPTSGSATR